MGDSMLCPLCGVPVDDAPGPVSDGDCPVHTVIGRIGDALGEVPEGLVGQESDSGLSVFAGDLSSTAPIIGWPLVDDVDVLEASSEADHAFEIVDEIDSFRSRQKLRYPDGTVIEDQGTAHEDGAARWKALGLQVGHDTLVIIRTDVVYAGGDLELTVDDKAITFPDFAPDRRYRWRNRVIPIPGTWIESSTTSMGIRRVDGNKDLSHFHIWIYQCPAPVPAPADELPMETVDIPASSLLGPPDATPAPLADDSVESLDPVAADAPIAEQDDASQATAAPSVDETPDPTPLEPDQTISEPAPAEPRPAVIATTDTPVPEPVAATQKLVTITLTGAEGAHGAVTAHLADELAAGWRIERLECVSGPAGSWLVVMLGRA